MQKKISYSLLENVISCHVTLYRVFLEQYAELDTLLPYELLITSIDDTLMICSLNLS